MPIIRAKGLFLSTLQMMIDTCDLWSPKAFSTACQVVGGIVDTEDFTTYRDKHYVKGGDDVAIVFHFEETCGKRLESLKREAPKLVRPVMDFVGKIKRMNNCRK